MVVLKDNDGNFDTKERVYYNVLAENCLMVVGNECYMIKDIQAYQEGTYFILEVF